MAFSTRPPAMAALLLAANLPLGAEPILVPNASFESPATAFVDNRVDFWRKTPKPSWYDETGGFTWDQLSGVFKNTDPGEDDHLENADGAQGFYLFAVPGVGIQLDETSTHAPSPGAPTPFSARFEPGMSYSFAVAVQGGGGGMKPGATLEPGLYYRDAEGVPRSVARITVTNDAARFPSRHLLADFVVRTDPVKPTDPWAGQGIGLQVLSTVDPALAGGYWNLDHARLREHPASVLVNAAVLSGGRFAFDVQGEPGARFEVRVADSAAAVASAWTPVTTITNQSGFAGFVGTAEGTGQRFYRVWQLP